MSSILDEFQLTIENFEQAIAVGSTTSQILVMFSKTGEEMDKWCRENYNGHDFKSTWEMVRQLCYVQFLDIVKELGCNGNPSALGIISKVLDEHREESVVKIQFINNMPLETEEDK